MTQIFDRSLVRMHMQRSQKAPVDFLWKKIARDMQDRLLDIKRDFGNVAEIGPDVFVFIPDFLKQKKVENVFSFSSLEGKTTAIIDEEFLPIKQNALDAFVSLGSLQWVNDVPGALVQARQALKPDGLFMAAMIGGETLWQLREVLTEVEAAHYDGISPRVSPFATLPDIAALMQRAGFALPVVDNEKLTITYAGIVSLINDLRGMGQMNAILRKNSKPVSRGFWLDVENLYREKYGTSEGRLIATVEVLYLIGWAPDASQQQPLKRGSATHRLSDILKTDEIGLEDFV